MSQALFIWGQSTNLFSKRIPVSLDQNAFDIPCPRYHFFDPKDDETISTFMLNKNETGPFLFRSNRMIKLLKKMSSNNSSGMDRKKHMHVMKRHHLI